MTKLSFRPYTMEEQPISDGRAFLARAFSFLCVAEWGFSPGEVEEALNDQAGVRSDEDIRKYVAVTARDVGNLFLQGHVQTFARPIGGGPPLKLPKTAWELDDFVPRFAKCALDPSKPFDTEAPCTHWIFVDTEQFDVILGRCGPQAAPQVIAPENAEREELSPAGAVRSSGRFLRLPEVLAMVGVSKSTLYDRMKAGRFPRNIELGGNLVVWREADVRSWMSAQDLTSVR
jgi:prophage regulatory protein